MTTELIRIPSARADQLRALAAHKNTTISNLIGELVAAEIERLGLAMDIGVGSLAEIAPTDDGKLVVSVNQLGQFRWPLPVALSLAGTLERMTSSDRLGVTLDMDAGVQITRKGNGVRIKNVGTGAAVTMASAVAVELGALLRAYAA